MIRFITMSALLLSLLSAAVIAQRPTCGDKPKYVIVPADSILLAVAAQPDCPLLIEDAKLLMSVDGRHLAYPYKLRNRGTKPIHYFTTAAWHSNATGGTLSNAPPWDGRVTDQLLQPGQVVSQEDEQSIEVVPLTAELRSKLELLGRTKMVVALMVERVEFADGTIYDGGKASAGVRSYFEEMNGFDSQ